MFEIAGGILIAVGVLFGLYVAGYILHEIIGVFEQRQMRKAAERRRATS